MYQYARGNELTERKPTEGIKPYKLGEHEPWPDDLLAAGLEAEHDRTRLAINLLYYTGQRIGDVVNLRWSDIRNGKIIVTPQKSKRFKKVLQIPVHSALEAILEETPKVGITIIVNHLGQPLTQADVVRKELKKFAADLGFDAVPHGLRKNAVNSLLEAGCTIAEVASITGQSFKVVEHYARRVNQAVLGEAAILKFEQKVKVQTESKTTREKGKKA